eukprot:9102511-Lingulodinium_polyedra.AAC.1
MAAPRVENQAQQLVLSLHEEQAALLAHLRGRLHDPGVDELAEEVAEVAPLARKDGVQRTPH